LRKEAGPFRVGFVLREDASKMRESAPAYRTHIPIFWWLLSLLFSLSSCVTVATDQDIMRLNDQVGLLNNRVNAFQNTLADREASLANREASLSKALSGDLQTRLSAIRGNQAQMEVEIDRIKEDLGRLSGSVEESGHLAKRAIERDTSQEDTMAAAVADLEKRVMKLEKDTKDMNAYLGLSQTGERKPVKVEEPKPEGKKISPEDALYEKSLAAYKSGDLETAISGFNNFMKTYPKSDLADNAQFWIGECHMSLNQYEQAILAYQKVIKSYPKGNKVPSAMLRQALAFQALKDDTSAKLLFEKLMRNYPKSNEAGIAKKKLEMMK
jgi:tol-pal system protein YbgF